MVSHQKFKNDVIRFKYQVPQVDCEEIYMEETPL